MLHTRSSTSTFIILALLTCSLAACKAKELPDEPYTPVSYNLYPAPQDAYVGDTMPFVTDDGTLGCVRRGHDALCDRRRHAGTLLPL